MNHRALLLALPLAACHAVLGIEDTSPQPSAAGDGGQGGAVTVANAGAPANAGAAGGETGGGGDTGGGGSGASGSAQAGEAPAGAQGNQGGGGASAPDPDDDWPTHSSERIFKVTHPWPDAWHVACADLESSDEQAAKDFWLHVQAVIADNWLRAADIAIVFSGQCIDNRMYSFRFHIRDGAAQHTELGYPGGQRSLDVTLGIESSDAEVLYTFGRALGFEHEYGREPYAGTCVACDDDDDCEQPQRRTCLGTGYCGRRADHDSIMGAPDCGGIDAGRRLTRSDVLGAQRAYGRKPAGSLLGAQNLCWNAESGIPAANLRITAWPCLRADNELWTRVAAAEDDILQAVIARQPFCAATSSSGTTRPLSTQTCSPTEASQRYQFRGVKLLTLGGLCVAARAAQAGSLLWTADCDSWSPDELADWDLIGGRIRLAGTELCITARDGVATLGAALDLEPCNAAWERQRLALQSGEIRYVDAAGNQACFNVSGGTGVPGEAVDLWNGCSYGLENLKFMARGRIEAEGRCAALLGKPALSTPIGMTTCDGTTSQIWDYYW